MSGEPPRVVHLFGEKLAGAQDPAVECFWDEVYDRTWPGCRVVRHNDDCPAQRAGYDCLVVYEGCAYRVEEKVRERDYGDVFLETVSDDRRRAPGWIERELLCDILAYAVPSTGKVSLFPWALLRAAWRARGAEWRSRFGERRAQNVGYVTLGVAVPARDIWAAIYETCNRTIDWRE